MEKIKALVVDDEMGIRLSVSRALRGFTVELPYVDSYYELEIDQAESGEMAVQMMKEKDYEIVLLDNMLPGIHGTEVLEWMNNEKKNSITIMITAFASIETAVSATKNGAYDFLTKPFTPQDLKAAVHKAAKHYILNSITRKLTEEKNKIRFQFISVLSHELKAPIAAIANYLKIMERQIAGDSILNYIDYIKRSLIRISDMEKLIFDLLDLTRIESGEKKRELEDIDFKTVIENSIQNYKEMAENKKITIISELESHTINGDKTELEIVANNFISNAIKYNKNDGSVLVSLTEKNNEIIFEVADTGIGIDENDIPKLFKEFSRIKNEKTAQISGSGIGLSTVKKIVSLYKGEIEVKSVVNEGTRFIVKLKK
ncbi:MAG: response regulator [Candidatus Delongbacteria bacterium]|nr:response regulator [Candidatus Delongbacteria bacterium]MBN2836757.1 response regulator [Candidatus Delongbacteria bacterium]